MSFASSNIGQAIYSLINSTVSVYPVMAPQPTTGTYATYGIMATDPDDVKDGTSWVDRVTVFITIHADRYDTCAEKALAVRQILDGHSGTTSGVPVDTIVFRAETDDYDDSVRKHIKLQEYSIRILNT